MFNRRWSQSFEWITQLSSFPTWIFADPAPFEKLDAFTWFAHWAPLFVDSRVAALAQESESKADALESAIGPFMSGLASFTDCFFRVRNLGIRGWQDPTDTIPKELANFASVFWAVDQVLSVDSETEALVPLISFAGLAAWDALTITRLMICIAEKRAMVCR